MLNQEKVKFFTNENIDYFQLISAASDVDDVKNIMSHLCEEIEMEKFIYGAQIPVSYVQPITTIIDGYPVAWRQQYADEGYIAIDPTVKHCVKSTLPLWWDEISMDKTAHQEFFHSAADHGLRHGISTPIQGSGREWGMLSFATERDMDKSHKKRVSQVSSMYLPFIHQKIRELVFDDEVAKKNSHITLELTSRELEVLLWTVEGKTAFEISIILKISERTVVFHLQNTCRKLNVNNRTHAVVKAISLGVINPLV